MEKETLLATSPSLQDLRRLIAEYYFTGLDSINLVDGFIYKKDKKLLTQYYQRGRRWRFVLKI